VVGLEPSPASALALPALPLAKLELLTLLELLPLEPLLELLELLLLELLLELPLPLGLLRLPCGGPCFRPRPLGLRRLAYFYLLSYLFLVSSVTPFAKSSSVGNIGKVCGW
jgi:hypothetical protein